jgi:TusA-related sulfurtransferase
MVAIQATSDNTITVLVDTEASKENVSRAAVGKGWKVQSIDENNDEYTLTLVRG